MRRSQIVRSCIGITRRHRIVIQTMPKANVVLAGGTKVTIEGTADEVATLLQRITRDASQAPASNPSTGLKRRRTRGTAKGSTNAGSARTRPKGPADYVRGLVGTSFFKTKRGLGDVQQELEQAGHIYAVTHLSPVLLRLVRARELRRIKESGAWKYVNR